METKTLTLVATDGTPVKVNVPTTLLSEERGDYLRGLFSKYVFELDGHWKGRVKATVPTTLADDVAEAMEFMGALVDKRSDVGMGVTALFSEGYWAHGF